MNTPGHRPGVFVERDEMNLRGQAGEQRGCNAAKHDERKAEGETKRRLLSSAGNSIVFCKNNQLTHAA